MVFVVVARSVEPYTFWHVEKDTALLYEVFCGLGDFIWGVGVFLAGAIRGFEELYGLVLCPDDVRDRGGPATRRL